MPEEERKIHPAVVIGIGLGLAGAAAAAVYVLTREKLPPVVPTIYTCPYCPAEFGTEEELLAHIELMHPGEPPGVIYTCPECGAEFATEKELLDHIEETHPEILTNLYGRVTDAISGKGIIGVLVTADLWQGYTDKNGNYAIVGIEPGTYTVTFSKGGYKEEVYEVTIKEGSNRLDTELISILPPGFQLSTPTVRNIFADGSHILISTTVTNYGGTGSAVIKWLSGADPSRSMWPWENLWVKDAMLVKEITLGPNESRIWEQCGSGACCETNSNSTG